MVRGMLAIIAALSGAAPALAAETIAYSYDVHGRLVTAAHSGTVNNGLQTSYSFDATDNRTNVAVTGAPIAARAVSPSAKTGDMASLSVPADAARPH